MKKEQHRGKVDASLYGAARAQQAVEEATTQQLEQPPTAPTPAPARRRVRALPAPKRLVQKPVDRDAELGKLRKQFGHPASDEKGKPAPTVDDSEARRLAAAELERRQEQLRSLELELAAPMQKHEPAAPASSSKGGARGK